MRDGDLEDGRKKLPKLHGKRKSIDMNVWLQSRHEKRAPFALPPPPLLIFHANCVIRMNERINLYSAIENILTETRKGRKINTNSDTERIFILNKIIIIMNSIDRMALMNWINIRFSGDPILCWKLRLSAVLGFMLSEEISNFHQAQSLTTN